MKQLNVFSCEIEDWFHILDSNCVPQMDKWQSLPLLAGRNVARLLELFDRTSVKATFFCLGWMAQRLPQLVRQCHKAGHEIASHGYAHILAYRVGSEAFFQDILSSKMVLEDIIGQEVIGFRCPGFAVTAESKWVFDAVTEAGFLYDASVFPAYHGHGGLRTNAAPDIIQTSNGPLVEIPVSTVRLLGHRYCLFGGGYLRISPLPAIGWAVRRLHRSNMPLVVYIHPREIDPQHPRLALRPFRRFKCYVNLNTTMPKLRWLCEHYRFTTMADLAVRIRPQILSHIDARYLHPTAVQ